MRRFVQSMESLAGVPPAAHMISQLADRKATAGLVYLRYGDIPCSWRPGFSSAWQIRIISNPRQPPVKPYPKPEDQPSVVAKALALETRAMQGHGILFHEAACPCGANRFCIIFVFRSSYKFFSNDKDSITESFVTTPVTPEPSQRQAKVHTNSNQNN